MTKKPDEDMERHALIVRLNDQTATIRKQKAEIARLREENAHLRHRHWWQR